MNALKHGLTARTPLLPGEDATEFREFVWAAIDDLEPDGPVQLGLAQRVAVLMWKRRRVDEAERQVFQELQEHYEEEAEDILQEMEEFAETEEAHKAAAEARAEERANGAPRNARCMLADELAGEPGQKVGRFERRLEGKLDRLARHEHRLIQQADSALRLLLKLQNHHREREETPELPGVTEGQGRVEGGGGAEEGGQIVSRRGEGTPASKVPAQNELVPGRVEAPETRLPRTVREPPGMN
jgi:hypothetical protein